MHRSVKRLVMIVGVVLLLVACKPSDKYVGEWYALANDGKEVIVHFDEEKELTITNEGGEEEKVEFNQTSTGFINEVSYFGIEMDSGYYYVVFDNKKDEANAKLIKQTNQASDFEDVVGDIVFKMNRADYPETF